MMLDGSFYTKVVGVTFKNDDGSDRQRIIRNLVRNGELEEGTELFFEPEPTNPYDRNCIKVLAKNGQQVGNLSKDIAAQVTPQIKQGYTFKAYVSSQTGGDIGYAYGINMRVERYKGTSPQQQERNGYYSENSGFQLDKHQNNTAIHSPATYKQASEQIISSNPQVQKLYIDALNGDMVAQHNMGGCYMEGYGVEKNPREAIYWFRKAADSGSISAMDNLGLMYMQGIGVEKDPNEALTWFVLAANSGSADAQNNLGCCYMEGVGVRRDPMNAVKWWKMAANQNHGPALFNLALVYMQGNGVEEDTHAAIEYMFRSSQAGHQPAIDFINSLPS